MTTREERVMDIKGQADNLRGLGYPEYDDIADTLEALNKVYLAARAALEEIRDYPEGEDGRLDSMEAIAREALQGDSDE